MPEKRIFLQKSSVKQNPTRHPFRPKQETFLDADMLPASQSEASLQPQMQITQRQGTAIRLGRMVGNSHLGKILAGTAQNAIQRQEHTPETGETESADGAADTPAGATTEALDAVVQTELEAFLNEFSNIAVTVRWGEETESSSETREEQVTFHPPYFMNVNNRGSAAAETLRRYDDAIRERGAASRAIRNFIREFSRGERRGGWGMGRALVGKSTAGDLQRIAQEALDRELIPTPAGAAHPNGDSIRSWLQRYGIGVDCSAFVSQALNRATAQVLGRDLTSAETLNTNSAGLAGGARGFTRVDDPADLRPGDTMRIPGHIRIITRVTPDESGGQIFTTAESRAGGSADVGPDRADWRYNSGNLQIRRSPTDAWSNSSETPTFGRNNALDSARTAAATAE